MPRSHKQIEAALRHVTDAARSRTAQYLAALPLRADDVAALNRSICGSPEKAQLLAALQQEYCQQWIAILQSADDKTVDEVEDRRFRSQEWQRLPWFRLLRELYALNASYIERAVALADLTPQARRRLSFVANQLIEALSPTNFPVTNPEAIVRALETDGESFARGARTLAADLARGQITMTDESAFEVGRNLAVTPGEVIFENELIQLIQYRPATDTVYSRPLLIVPPFINKYYILDLQQKNSFVRFCVDQAITTFIISWRNIPQDLGHLTWDDYVAKGIRTALTVVADICDGEAVNVLGYCVGGTLLASALAASPGQCPVRSMTLLASMLDFSDTGDVSVYVDEQYVAHCEKEFAHGGCVRGSQLANAFASLRARELVWHFVANNYLLGRKPKPFDLLYWNSDGSNLPGPLYTWYLRNMYLENRLRNPGDLSIEGKPADLGSVSIPAFVLAAREDHIVPWQSAYRSALLLGGETTFVLSSSGHVAGIVNPPDGDQRKYWSNRGSGLAPDAQAWLDGATEMGGSWWPAWMQWLQAKAGNRVGARSTAAHARYQPIESAPGRYVRVRGNFDI